VSCDGTGSLYLLLIACRTDQQKERARGVPTVAKVPINDPKHRRERAEEARTVADELTAPDSKRRMLRIADDYEELARRAERRLKRQRQQQQQQQQPKIPINDPKHWRERAEEARAVADVMTDEKSKKMMLRIAGDYEDRDHG
jgi:hypothetical protein